MKIQGAWIISHRNIVKPPYQTGWKWTRTAKSTQRNKKISKKCCTSMENHQFWSPGSTFQWCFYGGNYIGIFWGLPIELARPDGTVTLDLPGCARPAHVIMRSFDCWEPQLFKKYFADRGFHNILGSTIFKLFKSRWVSGCTAAGRTPQEFANRQLGDIDAGMYI